MEQNGYFRYHQRDPVNQFEIYSPVKQNQKHIEYLKSFLGEFGEVPCFSVITMVCDDFKISGVYPPNTAICNSLPAMERAIFKIAEGNQVVWDEAKKQKIFTYIQQNQQTGNVAREEHKKNVIAYKNDLEEMKRQNVCPYCKQNWFCEMENTALFTAVPITLSVNIR